jgi:DedD protein
MEAPLRQRIVGAIVLVTLGVIFIPALLDGSGYKSRQVKDIKIKEKPEFPPLTQKKIKPIPTPLDNIKQSQTKALESDAKQVHKKPIKSFALQVGTFDSNDNAEKMRDKLQKAGYTTYIRKSQSKGKTSYKVRIGPELEHSVLEKIKADIKKSQKIDAYIVNHS